MIHAQQSPFVQETPTHHQNGPSHEPSTRNSGDENDLPDLFSVGVGFRQRFTQLHDIVSLSFFLPLFPPSWYASPRRNIFLWLFPWIYLQTTSFIIHSLSLSLSLHSSPFVNQGHSTEAKRRTMKAGWFLCGLFFSYLFVCGSATSTQPTLSKMMHPTYPRRSSSTGSQRQRARTRSPIGTPPQWSRIQGTKSRTDAR